MSKKLFVFFTFSHGLGGHSYSITSYYSEFKKNSECLLLNIGLKQSPLNEEFSGDFFKVSAISFLRDVRRLCRYAKLNQVTEILCMDNQSYAYLRIVSLLLKIRIVLVKPGGPNPKRYFPKAPTLVNFSYESDEYFSSSNKHKDCTKYVVSNRIQRCKTKKYSEALSLLRERNKFVTLRISRISEDYLKSLMVTIRAFEDISRVISDSCLIIIGVVEDDECFVKLKKMIEGKNIHLLTDDEHIFKSKEFIHYCDFYIGCGRSAMEALMYNKALGVPSDIDDTVIIFNEETAFDIGRVNFSPRVQIKNYTLDPTKIKTDSVFNQKYFDESLEISKITEIYVPIFNSAKQERVTNFLDIILGTAVLYKQILVR
ncbi:hypothetical protein [Providencia manganoxydans]|uniref:hypothetical protein n=1 Tax=Providencia manganoxydans TaxID=2923283 RepID=UPI0034DDB7A6